MPGLLKDRPTGRLGRLISALRPARAGPLPVQTGFPTSLADLFVKNHGRLRKPSSCASAASRRKKRSAPPMPTPPPSPAPSPPASSPPSPPAAVSPPAQPIPDLPAAEPVCHTGAGGSAFGLGLGFLALVGVVSLALLVIWSRKVVAAVTVAAFSLFLLESARSFSLRRRPRAPATKEVLDLGGRGYVSPIREAEAEPEPPGRSCSDLDRGTDVVSILAAEEDRVEERGEAGDDGSNSKAKSKKRSWKKLIPWKLRNGRNRREADSPSVSSFRSESSDADALVGGNAIARATDVSDSRRGSSRRNQADAEADGVPKSLDSSGPLHGIGAGTDDAEARGGGPTEVDASADLAGVDGVGGRGSRLPFVPAVVVVVVLVGLVGGRLPAVALTVLCSALVSSLQRLSADLKGGA